MARSGRNIIVGSFLLSLHFLVDLWAALIVQHIITFSICNNACEYAVLSHVRVSANVVHNVCFLLSYFQFEVSYGRAESFLDIRCHNRVHHAIITLANIKWLYLTLLVCIAINYNNHTHVKK